MRGLAPCSSYSWPCNVYKEDLS
uniref:Uncharacterized protein n=1 Tax=Arundo donax TaxID=35708 RepID=A0A0A9BBV4_ARUDO